VTFLQNLSARSPIPIPLHHNVVFVQSVIEFLFPTKNILEILLMYAEGIRLLVASARWLTAALLIGAALLICPAAMLAQHGGGGGRGSGGMGGLGSAGAGGARPSGVSTKDDLKDFHRLMALQATPEQKAMFAHIVEDTQTAGGELKALRELLLKKPAAPDFSNQVAGLGEAVEKARTGNQSFIASFSPTQKSGLKDLTKKLQKTDSDLAKQTQELSQLAQPTGIDEHAASSAADLDKTLATFQSGQLAIGNEMSITLAGGQDLTYTFPPVTNSVEIAHQTIVIPAAGTISRASAEEAHNFSLNLTADLADLQREISNILRAQLDRSPGCGERVEILRATLTPLGTASLVTVRLHFERWFCAPGQGAERAAELAAGDGTIEIKFTPAVEQHGGWRLASEIGRVDGDIALRELLTSGSLGAGLRDQIAASLLFAMQKGTDLKSTLPPAAQGSASIEKAKFQEDGAGRLGLVLEEKLLFSDEQATRFAVQLKQSLSAQENSSP
jgi:hypothetical protein